VGSAVPTSRTMISMNDLQSGESMEKSLTGPVKFIYVE